MITKRGLDILERNLRSPDPETRRKGEEQAIIFRAYVEHDPASSQHDGRLNDILRKYAVHD